MIRLTPAAALALVLSPVLLAGEGGSREIGFDLDLLDPSGLYGPPDGRRALDYEYCIPRGEDYEDEVRVIDPSARFMPGSRGHIGCRGDEVLVLGNTHQAGWRRVLESLVELPYVGRIERTWLE